MEAPGNELLIVKKLCTTNMTPIQTKIMCSTFGFCRLCRNADHIYDCSVGLLVDSFPVSTYWLFKSNGRLGRNDVTVKVAVYAGKNASLMQCALVSLPLFVQYSMGDKMAEYWAIHSSRPGSIQQGHGVVFK